MKKLIYAIPVAAALVFTSCGLDVSRQTAYDYDRTVEEKAPSSGGEVQYPDLETGFIRDHDESEYHPDQLKNGTNLQNRNVKEPMPWPMDQQRNNTSWYD